MTDIVLAIPELGRHDYGHHRDLAQMRDEIVQMGHQCITLAKYDHPPDKGVVPWFSVPLHLDRNAKSSAIELHYFLELESKVKPRLVFIYNCSIERAYRFANVSLMHPETHFVLNILHFHDLSNFTSELAGWLPTDNLTLTTETSAGIAKVNKLGFLWQLELLPYYVPHLPYQPLDAPLHKDTVLLFGSANPTRGCRFALKALRKAVARSTLDATITIKSEVAQSRLSYQTLFQNELRCLSDLEIQFSDEWLDDERLSSLFLRSRFVIIPYSPEQFRYQLSGNFIHSLLSGAIPLVIDGTWMASELTSLNLSGLVAENSVAGLAKSFVYAIENEVQIRSQILELKNDLHKRYLRSDLPTFLISRILRAGGKDQLSE